MFLNECKGIPNTWSFPLQSWTYPVSHRSAADALMFCHFNRLPVMSVYVRCHGNLQHPWQKWSAGSRSASALPLSLGRVVRGDGRRPAVLHLCGDVKLLRQRGFILLYRLIYYYDHLNVMGKLIGYPITIIR